VVMGELRPGLRGLLHLDLNAREVATLAPLVLLALVIGLYPECVLGFLRASVTQLLTAVSAPGAAGGRL
jgi:NADH:ubiquinone oxidoreductase subunit 4 (subunit M)